jgi:hypothetical protein
VSSKLIVLDESAQRRHGILSVGGIVLSLSDLQVIEKRWHAERAAAQVPDDLPLKYSMSWPGGPTQRSQLIEAIGQLPLKAVIALLEDFRPLGMRVRKATRSDAYIHRLAFEWTLQRFIDNFLDGDGQGTHLVMLDRRNDFSDFEEIYARAYSSGWNLTFNRVAPLREHGFSRSLAECANGPMHEIADLLTSCVTRWADARCVAHKDGTAPNLPELDQCMANLIQLFPTGGSSLPPRRCGYSMVVHTQNKTGKELLRDNLDRWANDLMQPTPSNSLPDDIPF